MNSDKMTNDEVAIHSALIQWFEYDAILFYNLSKPNCNYAIFEYWLRFYNVLRNTPKDTREGLFKELKSHIKKFKSATGEDKDFLFAEQLASECKKRNITNVRILSLISKFACACNPKVFMPIDSINQRGLVEIIKKEGWKDSYKENENDYIKFMKLVTKYKHSRYQEIKNFYEQYEYCYKIPINNLNTAYYEITSGEEEISTFYKMPEEIFLLRFIDKRWMAEGSLEKITAEIQLKKERIRNING